MKVDIPIELLDEILNNSTSSIKLKSILGKRLNEIGYINNKPITSFKDACDVLGITEYDILKPNYDTKIQAFIKLSTVIEALNEGWKPDYNDDNQKKYYNWFKMENGLFVFYATHSYLSGSMSVPSALYLKDVETAIYCKDNFFELYKEYYIG